MLKGRPGTLFKKWHGRSSASERLWRRIAAGSLLAIGIAAAAFLKIQLPDGSADPQSLACIDQPLPSLIVEASGTAVDLKKIVAGAPCVIVFYSPSCRICREVLPTLQPFPDSLRLILINESADHEDSILSGFPNATHFHDRWGVISRSFAIAVLPTILFVDENGILRDAIIGSHGQDFAHKKLKEFAICSRDRIYKESQ
jgi:hypothetical protein